MPARKRPLSFSSTNDQVRPDPCDYQLIACSNCLQLLACVVDIVAMFDERATELANLIDCAADCFTCSVAGCMGAQIKHEMDKDQHGVVYAVAVPTPMSVAQAHGARLPLPPPDRCAHRWGALFGEHETKLRRSLVGKPHNVEFSRSPLPCPPACLAASSLARLLPCLLPASCLRAPQACRESSRQLGDVRVCARHPRRRCRQRVRAAARSVDAVAAEGHRAAEMQRPACHVHTDRRICVRRRQELARGGSAAGS